MDNVVKGSATFKFVGGKLEYDFFKKASFVPGIRKSALLEASNALKAVFASNERALDRKSIERAFSLALQDVNVEYVRDDLTNDVRRILDFAFNAVAFNANEERTRSIESRKNVLTAKRRAVGDAFTVGPRITKEEHEEESKKRHREAEAAAAYEAANPRKRRKRTLQEEVDDMLSKLPLEAWNVVFSYLPSISDLVQMGRVSKDAFVMIKRFVAQLFPSFIIRSDAFLDSFSTPDVAMRSVVSLDLTDNAVITGDTLRKFVNLRELNLKGDKMIDVDVVKTFVHLEKLAISVRLTDGTFFQTFRNLKRLELVARGGYHVSDDLSDAFLPKLVKLDYHGILWLWEEKPVPDAGSVPDPGSTDVSSVDVDFKMVLNPSKLRALEKLTIYAKSLAVGPDSFDAVKEFWASLSRFDNLKMLMIQGDHVPEEVTSLGFTSLNRLTNLTSLRINVNDMSLLGGLVNLTELNVLPASKEGPPDDYSPLANLKKLKRLALSGRRGAHASTLSNLTALTYLDVSHSGNTFSDDIFKYFTSLVHLNVNDCVGITGAQFGAFKKTLTVLHVEQCDDLILSNLELLTELTELHVDEVSQRLESISKLPKLADLYLRPYWNEEDIFTKETLPYWERMGPGLKLLSFVSWYPEVTEPPFWHDWFEYGAAFDNVVVNAAFGSYMTGLEYLRLEGASELHDETVSKLTNLIELTLIFCESVSEESLSELTGLVKLLWKSDGEDSFDMLRSLARLKSLALMLKEDMILDGASDVEYTEEQLESIAESLSERKRALAAALPYLDSHSRAHLV